MIWTRCNPPSSPDMLDKAFLAKLKSLEVLCGFELKITSGYRTYEHEIKHHRKGTSSHCKGLAVDIHVDNSYQRGLLITNAVKLGITRIGEYYSFVHLDIDFQKCNPCVFLGSPLINAIDDEFED